MRHSTRWACTTPRAEQDLPGALLRALLDDIHRELLVQDLLALLEELLPHGLGHQPPLGPGLQQPQLVVGVGAVLPRVVALVGARERPIA